MPKVLVAYASKRGSTADIARAIAAEYLDRRDWREISAWAAAIASELRTTVAGTDDSPATGAQC